MPKKKIGHESNILSLRRNLNSLAIHLKNCNDKKAKRKVGLKIFDLEEQLNRNNESMVFTSLHNNYLPEVADMVINAKFPGFIDKHLSFLNVILEIFKRIKQIRSVRLLIGNTSIIVA